MAPPGRQPPACHAESSRATTQPAAARRGGRPGRGLTRTLPLVAGLLRTDLLRLALLRLTLLCRSRLCWSALGHPLRRRGWMGWRPPIAGLLGVAILLAPAMALFAVAAVLFVPAAVLFEPAAAWGQDPARSIPPRSYYAARALLYDGEYRDALRDFEREGRSSIKTPQSRWIDSICYHAMQGECYYELGQNGPALEQFTAALQLHSAFSDWMIRLGSAQAIRPDTSRMRRTPPWGRSTRRFKLGRFPDQMLIGQGRLNNADVLQRGGVVQQASLFQINVHEIVRCTCLALRRRRELMGPLCPHDPLTAELVAKLARRPVPPNHWAEAWIDVQLGLANACAGQTAQAQKYLQRSLVAAGEYDHPLSCVALLELGKLALEGGDLKGAGTLLLEASYSAYYFENAGVLDEALRLGQRAHLMSGAAGVYPPLDKAARWVRGNRMRHVQVGLLALQAENEAQLGHGALARAALAEARNTVGRRQIAAGRLGARLHYLTALAHYQQGAAAKGDEELAAAIAFLRGGSRWLFQIRLADDLYARGTITPRVAMAVYERLLRDPQAGDWASEPDEALAVLLVPHEVSYAQWFDVALKRELVDRALEIADRARRHRFLSTLPLGGRLLALRRVLEPGRQTLTKAQALQRQDLLVQYPAFKQLSAQVAQLRVELTRGNMLPGTRAELTGKERAALERLASLSQTQEGMLRQIALRRVGADLNFPPILAIKELREALPPGQAVLAFYAAGPQLHGFLLTRENYTHWKAGAVPALLKPLGGMLRGMGNHDANRTLSGAELSGSDWQPPAETVYRQLFTDAKIDLAQGIDELVIVPDGPLWYLPFEALPIRGEPLLSRLRIRYVPTVSLAIPDARPRAASGNLGVVTGRLFPRDGEEVSAEALAALQNDLPDAVALPAHLAGGAATYGALLDRLMVLDDLPVDPAAPYGWVPIPSQREKSQAALAGWFALPAGGPDLVALPGFHTAAEAGLKRVPARPGDEIFLSVCGLMSGGARTVLLSRWRTGGQTSYDLVHELVQELPHTSAADAWQRSVELVREQPLEPDREPRVKGLAGGDAPTAAHPFFWSGYLLVDRGAVPAGADRRPAEGEAAPAPAAKVPALQPPAGKPPAAKVPAVKPPAAAGQAGQ